MIPDTNTILNAFEEGWRLGQYNSCTDFGEGEDFEKIWQESETYQNCLDITKDPRYMNRHIKTRYIPYSIKYDEIGGPFVATYGTFLELSAAETVLSVLSTNKPTGILTINIK